MAFGSAASIFDSFDPTRPPPSDGVRSPISGPITNPAAGKDELPARSSIRFPIERRRYPRFSVEPMYTAIKVRFLDRDTFDYEGHAYDVSEGGCRFELDRGIEMGTPIAMQLTLPTMQSSIAGPGRAIFVFGNVVWLEDEDEPGPIRMAIAFTRFARAGDRERLLAELRTGRYRAAA
jgi:hypothetical protein